MPVIPLTQEDIAAIAGTSRATVSRVLGEEQRRGTIAKRRRRIVLLDVDELARWARTKRIRAQITALEYEPISVEQAKASGTKPDWAQMQALHAQIQQETLQKLTPVLSASQLKKFQTLQEMHDGMHGHFGHGGPPEGSTPLSQN